MDLQHVQTRHNLTCLALQPWPLVPLASDVSGTSHWMLFLHHAECKGAKMQIPGFSPILHHSCMLHSATSQAYSPHCALGFILLSFTALQLLFLTWDMLVLIVYLTNIYVV